MATSGRIDLTVTGAYGNISGYILWTESDINTVANTSKVTATLYYANRSQYDTYSSVASPPFYLTINGNTQSTSTGITVSAYTSGVPALTHSVTVTHNNDGSKSVTISGGGGLSGTIGLQNSSGSGTATLTTILRHKPTASLSVSPSNANTVISAWGVYVKGYTKVAYTITGTPHPDTTATISEYEFVGNGETKTTATGTTLNSLSSAGAITLKARVKDSRGVWSEYVSQNISVYDYANPQITNASAFRSDANGIESANGTYITMSCTAAVGATIGGRNNIESIAYTITNNDTGVVLERGTLTSGTAKTISGALEANAYLVTITATDTVGISVVRTITVSKAITTLHLAENGLGVAVGEKSTHNNAFEINPDWDMYYRGSVPDMVVDYGTSGNWTYRKWDSGLAECWLKTTENLTSYTTVGSLYGYVSSSHSFPFNFTAVPTVVCGVRVGTGFGMFGGATGLSTSAVSFLALGNASGTQSCVFNCYAVGRWK